MLLLIPILPALIAAYGQLVRGIERTDLFRVLRFKVFLSLLFTAAAYYLLTRQSEYFWDRYFNNAADRKLFFGILYVLAAYFLWSVLASYRYRRKNQEDKTMQAISEEVNI